MTFEIKTKTMGKSHFFNRKFYKIKHAKYIISLYNYFKCFFKFPSYQKKKKENTLMLQRKYNVSKYNVSKYNVSFIQTLQC